MPFILIDNDVYEISEARSKKIHDLEQKYIDSVRKLKYEDIEKYDELLINERDMITNTIPSTLQVEHVMRDN